MADPLADRLKSDENAFLSLLSLVPSKLYYAEEAQTQWKKRKQTPEERKEAKRAKLDPDQTNSAAGGRPVVVEKEAEEGENGLTKSQIKNRAKKLKKLKEQAEKNEDPDNLGKDKSIPKPPNSDKVNGVSPIKVTGKKRKAESSENSAKPTFAKVNGVSKEDKQSPTVETDSKLPNGTSTSPAPTLEKAQPKITTNGIHKEPTSSNKPISKPLTNGIKPSPSPITNGISRSPSVPIISSPAPEVSSPSSISELRARLAARISQARLARKAIGTSVPGAPQTREAILQARAKRKAKVEEKIRAKREAQKQLVTPAEIKEESSDDEIIESGLKFGRVLIDDAEIDAGKGEVKVSKKKKGPSDAKGKLEQLAAKEERLAKMDPEKAERAKENDRWHSALLSARGEKVRDDTTLLKKTIARKEREKKKSKREWDERIASVAKRQEDRQKKREENLAKRREEKGHKGKKVVKSKKPVVKKKRPGFEGGRVKIGRK